jgi:hypothetical protein
VKALVPRQAGSKPCAYLSEVARHIRLELSWPFSHSHLVLTSIAHLSMKQDQVPIT